MPKSCRDIGIFEYCQYVMGTSELYKLLNINLVLPSSGCNHGTITGLLQNGNEINCI